MRRLNAVSILTLVLSIGTLVITATGTGSLKSGDTSQPPSSPSSPIIIDADGRETAALVDVIGAGEVGVMLVGEGPDSSVSAGR